MTDKQAWMEKLLAPLPEEKIRSRMKDDNPHWEFIDGEMVKLGALSHSTLNIADIQQRILLLLAEESKDFRLLAHLLRTLQHAGQPQDVVLALQLLCAWVKTWWATAWPDNAVMKRRLAQQVMKRFSTVAGAFVARASDEQRQDVLGELAHLAQLWQPSENALAQEADALGVLYRRQPERAAPERSAAQEETPGAQPLPSPASPAPLPEIDSSGEKGWRQTQLQMAEILCQRQPDNPLGYRLRRNAIWHSIASAPQAQADGRTPLAAFSADRMAEYVEKLANADPALWGQVEQSLTLAPYWFDGHRLSALIARQLGHEQVAESIREELQRFLLRLPPLTSLLFTDRTPFLSPETRTWLEEGPAASAPSAAQADIDEEAVWQCWRQLGLEAALGDIDRIARQQDPRGRFYCQLLEARLLSEAGLTTLARQRCRHLYQVAQGITLTEWEPGLIAQLERAQCDDKE